MGHKVERGCGGNRATTAVVILSSPLRLAGKLASLARPPASARACEGGREASQANPFMPGLRIRADGWTVARTRTFLALLAQTGCVTDAARVAGVGRTSVNRSRKLFAAFDRACAEALGNALRGLEAVAYQRAVEGREMVILRDGCEVERRIMPSDSLLGLLLKRGDLNGGRDVQLTAEEAAAYELPAAVAHRFLSVDEFYRGVTFDGREGGKVQRPTPEETDEAVIARLAILRTQRGWERTLCDECRGAICGDQAARPLGLSSAHC